MDDVLAWVANHCVQYSSSAAADVSDEEQSVDDVDGIVTTDVDVDMAAYAASSSSARAAFPPAPLATWSRRSAGVMFNFLLGGEEFQRGFHVLDTRADRGP